MAAAPAPVMAAVDGEDRAKRALDAICSGFQPPDQLLSELLDVLQADNIGVPPTARLRSFVRAVQKHVEGSQIPVRVVPDPTVTRVLARARELSILTAWGGY